MCCGSINLARYIYSSDSQREEWFGVGASAKSTSTPPRKGSAGPQATGPKSLISRKDLQTEKFPSLLCSGNVPEVTSAISVWLEPEPKAHISSWKQQPLPCIWDQWLTVASASLLNWCSFVRSTVKANVCVQPSLWSRVEEKLSCSQLSCIPEPWSISLPVWNKQESKLV